MTTNNTFADLGVPAPLIGALTARGISDPFPIQINTLPDTLAGHDVLGRGKTGSGKTLAFSIPLAARLASTKRRPAHPTGLVLAPTRELATQITATLAPLASCYGLKVTTIFGGVSQTHQVAALKSASPGSWPPHRQPVSGCCSPPHWITASTSSSNDSCATLCCTPSMRPTRLCRR
jgi:superfamily II DNA/RNA helicase